MNNWFHRDVISILDFSRDDLEILFDEADIMLKRLNEGNVQKVLSDKIVALAFFEPSTRTRMSFETAAKRLGAATISFTAEEAISISKGESFADTIRMLDNYSDLIVVRHRLEGAALFAAEIAESPVINGGDGRQHHPTQAMLDLFTIRRLKGSIDDLTIGILGDLKYGRAASSFLLGLTLFRPKKLYLISPPELKVRPEIRELLKERNVRFEEVNTLADVLSELDVLYVTRIQKERFPDPREYERVKGSYRITSKLLYSYAKKDLKVLHPLPRVDEITYDVDETSFAAYFIQARYGVPLRMALLNLILKGDSK